jgi:hypothetical protein
MNAKRTLLVAVVIIVLIAAGASLVYAQSRLASADRDARSLAGSWIINITPAPETGVPPFVNYSAMTKDGRLISSNDAGHTSVGEWSRTAGNQFAVTFMGSEVSDDQTTPYKVRSTVELSQDGEEFTGPFITEVFDADGNVIFTRTGTIQATRIHVEPLD